MAGGNVSMINKGNNIAGGIPPIVGGPSGGSAMGMPTVGSPPNSDLKTTMELMKRLGEQEKETGGLANLASMMKPSGGSSVGAAGGIGTSDITRGVGMGGEGGMIGGYM